MTPRERLAWGAVGGLSFLVLLQGYELIVGVRVEIPVKVGVALLVTGLTTGLTRLWADFLAGNGRA